MNIIKIGLTIFRQITTIGVICIAFWIIVPFITGSEIDGDIPLLTKIKLLVVCLVGTIILNILL